MKAARLHALGQPLRIDTVPVPAVARDEVLLRIEGAGVCHSDLHIRSGEFPLPPGFDMPLTLGHENAGYVEAVGPDVTAVKRGDAVAVWGGRGCGSCRICRQGDEQCCKVLGIGGLGHMALQILRALAPSTRVIAVDVSEDRLEAATRLGASDVVDARGDAAGEIVRLTGGEGVQAVIDLVGSDSSLRTAAAAAGRKSIIVVVGLAGGTLPYSFLGVRSECTVTCSYWGSYTEFQEVLALARSGSIRPTIRRYSLGQVNDALDSLERGQVQGRAVVTP